jgi:hypothetical protein
MAQNWESILAARILMALSASIIFTLGVVHLVYTFWGPKLTPRDPALEISMSQISPVITKENDDVAGWGGLQCQPQHGTDFVRLSFRFSRTTHGQLLFRSPFLLVVGLAMLGGLVVLSKVYFSRVPLTGVCISLPAMSPASCYRGPNIALSRNPTLRCTRIAVG